MASIPKTSAQRRRAGQLLVALHGGLHHRVMAQCLVVVEVLVALRDGEDALAQNALERVCATGSAARVSDSPGDLASQPHPPLYLPQQQDACVAGDMAAIKGSFNLMALQPTSPAGPHG